MTQDVRMHTILDRMIAARQSLHLAVELAQAAREPKQEEKIAYDELMRQILAECQRLRKYLLLDVPPKPIFPSCLEMESDDS